MSKSERLAALDVCDAFDVLSLSEAYGGSGATVVSSKDLTALDKAIEALRSSLAALPPPTGEPAEGETHQAKRFTMSVGSDGGSVQVVYALEYDKIAAALTSQSAELLSLRRKMEETEAERDALRKALKPFAEAARKAGYYPHSHLLATREVTIHDFRRARALAGDKP